LRRLWQHGRNEINRSTWFNQKEVGDALDNSINTIRTALKNNLRVDLDDGVLSINKVPQNKRENITLGFDSLSREKSAITIGNMLLGNHRFLNHGEIEPAINSMDYAPWVVNSSNAGNGGNGGNGGNDPSEEIETDKDKHAKAFIKEYGLKEGQTPYQDRLLAGKNYWRFVTNDGQYKLATYDKDTGYSEVKNITPLMYDDRTRDSENWGNVYLEENGLFGLYNKDNYKESSNAR
jgi:hypothetical protein